MASTATPTPTNRLDLKLRSASDEVTISTAVLTALLSRPDAEVRSTLTRLLTGAADGVIHDRRWLELICSSGEDGGMAASEFMPWLKLRSRVERLDPNKEGTFQLSASQAELIKKRLKSPKFKLAGLSPQFAEFLLDFCAATGWTPYENADDWWEPEDEAHPATPALEPHAH